MSYGFVYMLHNPQMLCIKIGCTERSPHARAEELSKPTGVPAPFVVACYIEVKDFQDVERKLHGYLDKNGYRANPSREFFDEAAVRWTTALMYHWPNRLAFTEVDTEFLYEHLDEPVEHMANPWNQPPKPAPVEQAPALRVVGGADGGIG